MNFKIKLIDYEFRRTASIRGARHAETARVPTGDALRAIESKRSGHLRRHHSGQLSMSVTFVLNNIWESAALRAFGCYVPENVLNVLSIPFREMTVCRGLGLSTRFGLIDA